MRYLHSAFSALLGLALCAPSAAQPIESKPSDAAPTSAALDIFENQLQNEASIPAFGIAVIACRGLDVRTGGVRKAGGEQTIGSGARFNIGSNAKSMLATAAVRLQQRNVLSLEATIADLWPEMAETHPDKADITLRQLLSHTSGLPAFDKGSELGLVPEFPGEPSEVRKAAARWFLAQPLAASPASQTIYSNAGYVVAGHLLERASGKPLPELLRTEVFEPIGIDAGLGEPRNMPGSQPMGHYMSGETVLAYEEAEPPIPAFLEAAGNVSLSPLAYARYLQAHLCALEGEADFLSPELASTLHTPVGDGGSALGWGVAELRGTTVSFHVGGTGDFTAYAAVSQDTGKAALAVFNTGGGVTGIAQGWLVDVVTAGAPEPELEKARTDRQ